jgi:hypothetical protein
MHFGDHTTAPQGVAWKDKVLFHQPGGLIFDGQALQPKPSVGVTGYWWKATAVGPEGLPGLDDGTPGRRCYVLPDVPELLEPPWATIDAPGDYGDITFKFTSSYSPSGKYRLTMVWGPPVGGGHPVIPGNPGGISQFAPSAVGLSGLKPGRVYQWMLKAYSDIPKSAGGVSWAYPLSEMRNYVTRSQPPPPPPAPVLIEFIIPLVLPSHVVAFERVPGAFRYQAEAFRVEADDQTMIPPVLPFERDDDEISQDITTVESATGQNVPFNVYWMILDGTDPSVHYKVRVRACAGTCGQFSNYGLLYTIDT